MGKPRGEVSIWGLNEEPTLPVGLEANLSTQASLPPGELAPGETIGEYRIEAKVGQGGTGVVYRATHAALGKPVAIKVLRSTLSTNPEAIARFVQEARAIGGIGHPNIISAFGFGTLPGGCCYFVMEWLKGRSLTERLQLGRLSLAEAVDLLDQVCRALEAAHERGIVHRDLKPDNVFLVDQPEGLPRVKLLDFSIAKLADPEGIPTRLTATGVMLGTPAYISPEQARCLKVDQRADIYSLGVLSFQALCGRLPFPARSRIEIVELHLRANPPAPSSVWPDLPRALDTLILRMMAKAPEARPSLREIRAVLEAVRDPSAAPAFDEITADDPITRMSSLDLRLPPAMARPPRLRLTGRVLGCAIAVAVVAVSAFGLIALRAQPAPSISMRPRKPAPTLPPVPTAVESLPQPGTVAVAVDVPNARIVVDGKLAGESVTYARVLVERPGRHEIEVSAPGKPTFRTSVEVGEGATVEVEADLDPRVASDRPARKTPRPRPGKGAAPAATGDQLILDPYRRRP